MQDGLSSSPRSATWCYQDGDRSKDGIAKLAAWLRKYEYTGSESFLKVDRA
jgi:hypothetical protein